MMLVGFYLPVQLSGQQRSGLKCKKMTRLYKNLPAQSGSIIRREAPLFDAIRFLPTRAVVRSVMEREENIKIYG